VISNAVWAVVAGVLGLAIGSFLNVVIYRVPVGESVVRPPSRCPSCGATIRNRHNIPVAGWLALRGRCYECRAPISARYPIVELITGLLFGLITLRILDLDVGSALPAYLYLTAAGIALAVIDIDHKRLPNKIVLPSYPVLAVLLTIAAAAEGDWWALARAAIGGAALFSLYFVIAFIYPAGMGFGDVKLAGVLGGALGFLSWSTLAVGAFLGFVLGAVGGVFVLATGRGTRKSAIPFGPYMIGGALLAIFIGQRLGHAYLHQTGRV
jgi:leader peptidase (prepilin peptidase)/N-methyltransferase